MRKPCGMLTLRKALPVNSEGVRQGVRECKARNCRGAHISVLSQPAGETVEGREHVYCEKNMKYIRLFFLVSAVALTICMYSVTAHAAETETVTQTVTQEASEDSSTQESNNNDIYYVVFIGSALLGSLVALGLWITFRS